MVVLDNYKNHFSIQFEKFYKEKNIIIFYFFTHSSHLIQLFDIECFNILKRSYNRQFKTFIKAYINYITKTEFFITFKAAHLVTITVSNIQRGFRDVGLILYNLQTVLSKFNIKLRMLTSTGPPLLDADPWVSQTPYNPTETLSQSEYVQRCMTRHQGSSPTNIFAAVKQLAKETELLVYEMILIREEVRTLCKANKAFAKRRKAKKTYIRARRALSI